MIGLATMVFVGTQRFISERMAGGVIFMSEDMIGVPGRQGESTSSATTETFEVGNATDIRFRNVTSGSGTAWSGTIQVEPAGPYLRADQVTPEVIADILSSIFEDSEDEEIAAFVDTFSDDAESATASEESDSATTSAESEDEAALDTEALAEALGMTAAEAVEYVLSGGGDTPLAAFMKMKNAESETIALVYLGQVDGEEKVGALTQDQITQALGIVGNFSEFLKAIDELGPKFAAYAAGRINQIKTGIAKAEEIAGLDLDEIWASQDSALLLNLEDIYGAIQGASAAANSLSPEANNFAAGKALIEDQDGLLTGIVEGNEQLGQLVEEGNRLEQTYDETRPYSENTLAPSDLISDEAMGAVEDATTASDELLAQLEADGGTSEVNESQLNDLIDEDFGAEGTWRYLPQDDREQYRPDAVGDYNAQRLADGTITVEELIELGKQTLETIDAFNFAQEYVLEVYSTVLVASAAESGNYTQLQQFYNFLVTAVTFLGKHPVGYTPEQIQRFKDAKDGLGRLLTALRLQGMEAGPEFSGDGWHAPFVEKGKRAATRKNFEIVAGMVANADDEALLVQFGDLPAGTVTTREELGQQVFQVNGELQAIVPLAQDFEAVFYAATMADPATAGWVYDTQTNLEELLADAKDQVDGLRGWGIAMFGEQDEALAKQYQEAVAAYEELLTAHEALGGLTAWMEGQGLKGVSFSEEELRGDPTARRLLREFHLPERRAAEALNDTIIAQMSLPEMRPLKDTVTESFESLGKAEDSIGWVMLNEFAGKLNTLANTQADENWHAVNFDTVEADGGLYEYARFVDQGVGTVERVMAETGDASESHPNVHQHLQEFLDALEPVRGGIGSLTREAFANMSQGEREELFTILGTSAGTMATLGMIAKTASENVANTEYAALPEVAAQAETPLTMLEYVEPNAKTGAAMAGITMEDGWLAGVMTDHAIQTYQGHYNAIRDSASAAAAMDAALADAGFVPTPQPGTHDSSWQGRITVAATNANQRAAENLTTEEALVLDAALSDYSATINQGRWSATYVMRNTLETAPPEVQQEIAPELFGIFIDTEQALRDDSALMDLITSPSMSESDVYGVLQRGQYDALALTPSTNPNSGEQVKSDHQVDYENWQKAYEVAQKVYLAKTYQTTAAVYNGVTGGLLDIRTMRTPDGEKLDPLAVEAFEHLYEQGQQAMAAGDLAAAEIWFARATGLGQMLFDFNLVDTTRTVESKAIKTIMTHGVGH